MLIRKFATIVLILFLFCNFLFADINISLESNKKNYNVDETINLTVKIKSNNQNEIAGKNIIIEGINNFDQVGQSNNSYMQRINNEVNITQEVILYLKAKKKGDYELGPAIIPMGTGRITSNKLNINITGDKMFVGNVDNNLLNQLNKKENISKTLGTDNIIDTEIDDNINKSLHTNSFMKNYYWLIIIVLLFIFLVFVLIKLTISSRLSTKKNQKIIEDNDDFLKEYKLPSEKSKNFIQLIEDNLYLFLQRNMGIDNRNMTFEEIKKNEGFENIDISKKDILNVLFKQIEKYKYSKNEIDKNNILVNVKKLIK